MLNGIDVSHHNGNVNWQPIKQAGIVYAFAKVTEGVSFVDSQFANNWQGMKAAGIVRGAYHYFRALQDPQAQAANFLAHVQLEAGDMPPVVDVEGANNKTATNAQWINGLQAYLNIVQAATHRVPIIYTRASFWNPRLNNSFGNFPLWVAHYGVNKPTLPNAWTKWAFWQYTDQQPVPANGPVFDGNRFDGSVGDLNALA
jgi:lysozyme